MSEPRSRATAMATHDAGDREGRDRHGNQGDSPVHPQQGDQQLGDPGQGDGQCGEGEHAAGREDDASLLDRLEILLQLDRGQAGLEFGEGEEVLGELGDVGDDIAGAGAVPAAGAGPSWRARSPMRPDAAPGPLNLIDA